MEPFKTHDALFDAGDSAPAGTPPSPGVSANMSGECDARDSAPAGTLPSPGVPESTRGESSSENSETLTRLDILQILIKESKNIGGRVATPSDLNESERICLISKALADKLLSPLSESQNKQLKHAISYFISKCAKKLQECKRNMTFFKKKNMKWLQQIFINDLPQDIIVSKIELPGLSCTHPGSDSHVPENAQNLLPVEEIQSDSSNSGSDDYESLSQRHQLRARKRELSTLEGESPAKVIKTFTDTVRVASEKLSTESAHASEAIINESLTPPTKPNKELNPYTPDEALGLMIEIKMSVDTYKFFQQDTKDRGFPIYPPYNTILEAKQLCYPTEEIHVNEVEASVSLQGLLGHTFKRIIFLCEDAINQYCEQNQISELPCVFEGSWGLDGSTGQALYEQEFCETLRDSLDENSVIATTFVPLRLKEVRGNKTIWVNPSPRSYRYCRPLHIQFKKETSELIIAEKEHVQEQIRNLTSINAVTSKGFVLTTTCELTLSIIQSKVPNIINNTSSQQICVICKLPQTQFNDLDLAFSKTVIEQEILKIGLSPFHTFIRCLEFLLQLGYKNDPNVRCWPVRKQSVQGEVTAERKKRIQNEIRDLMGLSVNIVRPNSGATNDGYTAWCIFATNENRQCFADILGLEKWLVDEIYISIASMNCGLPIDAKKFGIFGRNLAQKYVATYGWHPMSTTLHKILVHGREVIETSILPVGLLSKQSGEFLNKFREYGTEYHSQKVTEEHIKDLFRRALESSDPVVSSSRLKERQNSGKYLPLPKEVMEMLKPLPDIDDEDDDDEGDDSDFDVDDDRRYMENDQTEFSSVVSNENDTFVE